MGGACTTDVGAEVATPVSPAETDTEEIDVSTGGPVVMDAESTAGASVDFEPPLHPAKITVTVAAAKAIGTTDKRFGRSRRRASSIGSTILGGFTRH